MAGAGAKLQWPVRPYQRFVFLLRRHGHNFELRHARCAMAGTGAYAVRTGVTTANHHHMFAIRTQLVFQLVAGIDFVLLWQKFHREMNACQITARCWQVARLL